jgi:tetratricopeptide (TPR) repeat protein
MSLFIDVIDPLSSVIKEKLNEVIEAERKDQPRPIRRICETCSKYLDYGELRYDKMEAGIKELVDDAHFGNSLFLVLMAIMNESLDEDQKAVDLFAQFSENHAASEFQQELTDFITIGKFATLKQFDLLETAGNIIIERYSDERTITDTLSNMYLKVENDVYIPVIQGLLAKAREKYPEQMALESLTGFIQIKAMDYQSALTTFTAIKDKLLIKGSENSFINDNLASLWDNMAICYLKLGDAAKTIESCDTALGYDNHAVSYRLGLPVLYKKAEALLMAGNKEAAEDIVNQILAESPEDETAAEIKGRLGR